MNRSLKTLPGSLAGWLLSVRPVFGRTWATVEGQRLHPVHLYPVDPYASQAHFARGQIERPPSTPLSGKSSVSSPDGDKPEGRAVRSSLKVKTRLKQAALTPQESARLANARNAETRVSSDPGPGGSAGITSHPAQARDRDTATHVTPDTTAGIMPAPTRTVPDGPTHGSISDSTARTAPGKPVRKPTRARPSLTWVPTKGPAGARLPGSYVLPLLGGAAALLLAWAAESIIRAHNTTPVSLLLYLLAAFLFAATVPVSRVSRSLRRAGNRGPGGRAAAVEARAGQARAAGKLFRPGSQAIVMVLALTGSLACGAGALVLLMGDLGSVPAVWLWLLSMVVLLGGAIIAARWQRRPALWASEVWPTTRMWARAAIAAIVLVVVVASVARLAGLDRVPFGINADEGDRAATAIQIIRGQNTQSLFDNGWYWISILYFWLLAQIMKVAGISYVGARVFGAIAGIISVGVVTWLGARNFGLRVGLVAGALLSLMAVSLQFARETSEAGPTATLWAAGVACLLEAARRGRYWAWTGAGLAGGLSIYFYPSGRLWAVLAALACAYLLVHGLGGRRREVLAGSALSGLASLLAAAPFLLRALVLGRVEMLTQRAQETSIFTGDNTTRLSYVEPGWNLFQLLTAQVVHSLGIFNQFPGETDFWPYDKPIMPLGLSLLTLLGLGWCCLRLRDPRFAILAIWFWVGMVGVIVTVETPNLQRMATAIPVLALFAALVLDSVAGRVETFAQGVAKWIGRTGRTGWADLGARRVRTAAAVAGSALVTLWAVALAAGQYRTYFEEYGPTDRWPQPSYLGWAVRDQGTNTWVFTMGRQYHMVNSGWVRLLAPDTPRGGLLSPGSDLRLSLPAERNLAFLVFPKQAAYLPYLRALYPGGTEEEHTHPTEGLMFTLYKVPRDQWARQEGALVQPPGGETQRVSNLGVRPPAWRSFPAQMRWTAELSVPRYWNYAFRVRPGPATLEIDGKKVLSVAPGEDAGQGVVSLARGSHYLVFEGTLESAAQAALLRWAPVPEGHVPEGDDLNLDGLDWQEIPTQQLAPAQDGPQGLYASVDSDGYPQQHRIDGTIASCRPAGQDLTGGESTRISWTGSLDAPSGGVYSMTLLTQGPAVLKIDDRPEITIDKPLDSPLGAEFELSEGKHRVELDYSFGPVPGCIEWVWTPPGGPTSIVPPSVLSPPEGAGIGERVNQEVLGREGQQPAYDPIDVVP